MFDLYTAVTDFDVKIYTATIMMEMSKKVKERIMAGYNNEQRWYRLLLILIKND
jgi:hypothetical protein